MISIGIDSDLNLYHGGTDSFIVNKIGNLELHTQEASKGFIFDAENGTVEIKEDGTLMGLQSIIRVLILYRAMNTK